MIKKLASCIRDFKKPTILTPVLVCLECAVEVCIPMVMAWLLDNGIDGGNMNNIIKYGIILLLLAGVALFLGVSAGMVSAKASAGFAKNLRHDMYENVQGFSFSNIDKFSTASIVTRLTTDVNNVQMAFQVITRMAVRAPLMMIFSLIVSFGINANLALIFIAAVPFLGVGLFFIVKNAFPIFERVFKTYDKLNEVVGEDLSGIRVVKSYNREEYEKSKFNKISDIIFGNEAKGERLVAFNTPLMQFSMYSCLLLISWFGARVIVSSGEAALSTGELMSLISYAIQILVSLMMLSMVFVMITISRASAGRIAELLSEKSDITNPENAITDVRDGEIVFDNVTFSYSRDADKPCLDGINLKIKSGQTVGILGGTGSSKSTLVQLIPRLYDVTDGSVTVGGNDVRKYDLDALRGAVAMVLQKNTLFSGTINDNLRWGNENADDEEIKRVCRLAAADDFVENMPDKYNTYIEQGGTNVSGGQKQRLCIARALLKKPKILILDDSTSAVDTMTDAKIRKAMSEELPATTKIIIAQRVASVQDADMIIVMDDGRISAAGTHDELMKTSGIYREVYDSQVKAGAIHE